MEQYEILPGTWYKSLRYALKHFHADRILLRTTGPVAGTVIVGERLDGKWMDLTKTEEGLLIEINGQKRGVFNVKKSRHIKPLDGKSWALAYERISDDNLLFYASSGFPNSIEKYAGPDDSRLPKVRTTMFRAVNMSQYIEVAFIGKIPILPTQRLVTKNFPDWYYWEINETKTTK